MFATATKNFVNEVDRGGLLIPVASLNDSIHILSVVVKRKRFWFWQKPKYVPTDFNLNDILTADTPITPVVNETDFIKYDGTFGDNIKGNVDANFAHASLNVEGKDASKLQSTFGSLKKEEVDVQKLLKDSKDRLLDMSHCLIQQTKEKQRQVFGIVKERIVTTQPCSVIEEVQQGGQLGGLVSFCGPQTSKFSLKENTSLSKDSNVTMEIPPHTTIAYSLMELEVKLSGQYELCLMADTYGGFEVDGPPQKSVLRAPQHAGDASLLKQEVEQLHDYFKQLSSLPASMRSTLLQHLVVAMEDTDAITALQDVLQLRRQGDGPAAGSVKTHSHKNSVKAVLDIVDEEVSSLAAVHLLTSALDEMTDDCLAVLRTFCSPSLLQSLEMLVLQCVLGSVVLPLSSAGLASLTDEVYGKAQHLFAYFNVTLKREGDTVKTDVSHQARNHPLVLCIAVKSLASLIDEV